MAIYRCWFGRFLDSRDDVGCVDGLWLLRIFIAVELEENPMPQNISANSSCDLRCEAKTYCLARLACTLSARLNER